MAEVAFAPCLERAQSSDVAKLLDVDHAAYLETLGDSVALADASDVPAALYKRLRPLLRPSARSNPVVRLASGAVTTTAAEAKLAFANHFALALDAQQMTPEALVARRSCDNSLHTLLGADDWSVLISRTYITSVGCYENN